MEWGGTQGIAVVRSPQFSRDPGSRELASRRWEPRLQGGEQGGSRVSRRPLSSGSWPVASVTRQLGRPVSMALSREPWAGVEQKREGGAVERLRHQLETLGFCCIALVHFK